jgi:hypothetical protein
VHNSKILEDNFLMPSSGLSWKVGFETLTIERFLLVDGIF